MTVDLAASTGRFHDEIGQRIHFRVRKRKPTIYIVPQRIRQVNEVAYEPQIVSIGPYHHGKNSLQRMEEHKWRYLHSILSRNPNHRLEDYLEAIEELGDEARICYSEKVGPQMSNEFVKMMVLDACFIVEFFLKFNNLNEMVEQIGEFRKEEEQLAQKEELRPKEKELEPEEEELEPEEELLRKKIGFFSQLEDFKDPILDATGMMSLVGYDMFLLENQIPFFVLQRIFMMACPVNLPHKLAEMALDFFDHFMHRNNEIQIKDSYCHLLRLFHSHLIPTPTHSKESNSTVESVLNKFKNISRFFQSSNKPQLPISNNPSPVRIMMIPGAAELQLAGVKFKKKEKYSSILDVEFSHGVLEIPPLSIYESSNALFRNLVAFEQCYPEATTHFTSYFWFMDCLVNTSKDVALLHLNEIINHGLESDDDVGQLFNRLCTGTFLDYEESYLSDLPQNVQKHCKSKWNMWLASLMRDYFTNPWSVISLIAASILLLLTVTQTFFTVLLITDRSPSS
ncbi:UPF0481 protein At3g47200-like [Magnolia sinica]|uniref:UPF0481 protein At3g47200-like n=1 Tax=Magnolia sinica TaxID=86752 RepID=UPI00265AEFED|nr:UPF0481 protein At3g47200-like [Magnolia sinica]